MPKSGTSGLSWYWALAACCVSIATVSTPAGASPEAPLANDTEKATARRLVGVGDDLFATGEYEKALAAYRGADLIMGVPTTGFEVARCLMALGRLREARVAALHVLRYPERPGEPEVFGIARAKSRALIGDLEERMAALRLEGRDTRELVVEVDGRIEQIDNGMIYVDAGPHQVVIKRGEVVLAEHRVDVAERTRHPIAIDESSSDDGGGPLIPAVAIASFSVASGAVVTGIVTGAFAFTMHDDALDRCRQDGCPSSAREDLETAKALSIASTVSFVVGAVGTATGVAALLLQRSDDDDRAPTAMRASIEPVIGLQQIGLRLTY